MKLMSRWIVFAVTSISCARVEQFGKRPDRTRRWISKTRHIAGRLTPARAGRSGLQSAVRLDISLKIIQKVAPLHPQMSHPLRQGGGV